MIRWTDPLCSWVSRGRQARRPGSLAGLAEARREHAGQFFTPDALAALLWRLVQPAIDRAIDRSRATDGSHEMVSLLDNSVGTGRLLQYADPQQHTVSGVDIDREAIAALSAAAEAVGFRCEFLDAGLESIRPRGYGVGLINPPNSLHLESPLLEPLDCTSYGRFGPHTSAMSHAYALHQALQACDVVAAIVPRGYEDEAKTSSALAERLCAIVRVPTGSFREEGTEVAVSILVFDQHPRTTVIRTIILESLADAVPDLGLTCRHTGERRAKLRHAAQEHSEPVITTPVTHRPCVRVTHQRRRVQLHFECGLVEAKVMNRILFESVDLYRGVDNTHRYPAGVKYLGQGKLDLECYLVQKNPLSLFEGFLNEIRDAGGAPKVDPGLYGYLRRRVRRLARQQTELRRFVYRPPGHVDAGAGRVTGKARKTHVVDPEIWGSPAIRAGTEVEFTALDTGRYGYEIDGQSFSLSTDELIQGFEVEREGLAGGWRLVSPGRRAARPDMEHALRRRALSLGIDRWLDWGYQLDDAIELTLSPTGSIGAWDTGLGKARLALALILLNGCRHGLIVVEPQLVPEMVSELNGLPIPAEDWQVIQSTKEIKALRRINIISYTRLRTPVHPSRPRRTYARLLRRRVGLMICDEGHLLRNRDSLQSQALWMVSARRRIILSATPMANMPRDLLTLISFVAGHGVAEQPYGLWRSLYLEPRLLHSMQFAERGIDRFRENFVTLEWVTNEFSDHDMQSGAKREVPRIANLPAYQAVVGQHVLRRVVHEPEVARWISIPVPREETLTIPWSKNHLAYYLKISEEFRSWYLNTHKEGSHGNNLVSLLARIGAVTMASNCPQHGVQGFGAYRPMTSKQQAAVDLLVDLTRQGRKSILYAENPGTLSLLHEELAHRGVDSLVFDGTRTIEQRTADLDARFRHGPCPVLLASLRVTQKGLNIPQANAVVFLSRSWAYTVELQALRRVLRPQQKNNVDVYFLHLDGGIDVYQHQMVNFKKECVFTGLDFGVPDPDPVEFLHLDTLLGRFCEDLAAIYGCKRGELRERLSA